MQERDFWHKRATKPKIPSDLHQYRYLRNQVTISISRHKKQFILNELNLNEGKPDKT